jgi:hypothetical protein
MAMDNDGENALRLARDRWVLTALALNMIEAVAPPKDIVAGGMHSWLEQRRGRIPCRPIPDGLSASDRVRAARRGRNLPPTEYEWNVEGLILCLLESRIAKGWTTPVELIHRLATVEPSELPGLALQRLAAANPAAAQREAGASPARGGAPREYPWDEIGAAFGAWLHESPSRTRAQVPAALRCSDRAGARTGC